VSRCEHSLVRAVLVGGPNGDQVLWLCANSDCKQEFIQLSQEAMAYDASDFEAWFTS
jgi:hypothetical protein